MATARVVSTLDPSVDRKYANRGHTDLMTYYATTTMVVWAVWDRLVQEITRALRLHSQALIVLCV